ncbi:subunit A1 of katanin p60 [Chloropicon primus]|uniref:Katanin p60 ATPase-containing subunit A1 n=1 Tax=Chloropicon primus TaxID=1764295 RepID=A0A5B8N157_9CHLO|nr:subunit A1 of katanin p60 [Chloropicon primus]UPR05017.1 subunit A1 of katanin p60 [Chloropicon primus]|eukprot:QDZ25822.1 subunit A1 of katanin p60 [Chloropicon primus]
MRSSSSSKPATSGSSHRSQVNKSKYSGGEVGNSVLDNLNKRFGQEGGLNALGSESSERRPCGTSTGGGSSWVKWTEGGGAYKWWKASSSSADETGKGNGGGTGGTLEYFGGSKQFCVIRYRPKAEDDADGHQALRGGGGSSVRVGMRFKCAHAAPASGHVPAFHLVLCRRKSSPNETLALAVDTKERVLSLEVFHIGETQASRVRTLHTWSCRDLRPGVFNGLVVESRADNNESGSQDVVPEGITLSIVCNDTSVAESVAIRDDDGVGEVTPVVALGVSRSRLEWDDLVVKPGTGTGLGIRSMSRFRGNDMSLVQAIEEEMLEIENPITFDDIASLKGAKELLNEAVTLPLLIPEFFVGIREPWKGVLLFGPPGTGKTLLARAVASMSDIRFFNCSSAAMTSKWRGESEKLCKVLFQMARHYAPSIIFFDEVDAQVSQRGQDGEHEASRRFKSELLSQMDGIASGDASSGKNVIVLATTNCPWDVDEAMRRRLEKRIYIPLPDEDARTEMFKIYLKSLVLDEGVDVRELAGRTQGFSGADIKLLCRDASMMPMRRVILNKTPEQIRQMKLQGQLDSVKIPLLRDDFDKALSKMQPSVSPDAVARYEKWKKEFASE